MQLCCVSCGLSPSLSRRKFLWHACGSPTDGLVWYLLYKYLVVAALLAAKPNVNSRKQNPNLENIALRHDWLYHSVPLYETNSEL